MLEESSSLLLVLPVPIHKYRGELFLDSQACNGLRLWLENFETVTSCHPCIESTSSPADVDPLAQRLQTDRLRIEMFPIGWTPLSHFRALPQVRRKLRILIPQSKYLQFAIGGAWGDWGAIATLMAFRMGRKAAVWTDRVESSVMRFQAGGVNGPRRFYRFLNSEVAKYYERYVISRSALGLFHGMDTYSEYQHLPERAELVHNIHVPAAARISGRELNSKMHRTETAPLRLIYVGRVHADKGVEDWIRTMRLLRNERGDFIATWIGDGPELEKARKLVQDLDLNNHVGFPGPESDRSAVLSMLRNADAFVFCHKTAESPRCLIEALLSGTPLVGYASPYSCDLINGSDGGILTPKDDVQQLAGSLLRLRRVQLNSLTMSAARSAVHLTEDAVFAHRATLIKNFLN